MEDLLRSKTALVTGGSSGIGRATALAFAQRGAKVVVAARRIEKGEETVELIRKAGGEGRFVRTDVSVREEVEELVDRCIEFYGGLDIACNNAGIEGTPYVPTVEYEDEVWDNVMAINLKGVWLCMKAQIRQMLRGGGGSIVNMASVAGLRGVRFGSAYCASKHGVIGLTKAAAREYAAEGIRVNAVCPAVIKTEMAERAFFGDKELTERANTMHPIGRLGEPEDVASAVVWLCSDSASFVTGHSLPVDGGVLI
jgi:NAD(P)-dependent dehydrogenase (short-subunit alcohol dehydrogenase family)